MKGVTFDTGEDGLSTPSGDIFEDDLPSDNDPTKWDPVDLQLSKPEANEYTAEAYDTYIGAQVYVPIAGELTGGKFLKRKLDKDGIPIDSKHKTIY